MNDRIKELAAQCATDYVDRDGHFYIEFDKEKFAELIVKECADVVRTSLLPSQNKVPATVALDIAAKNIELIFGVKE